MNITFNTDDLSRDCLEQFCKDIKDDSVLQKLSKFESAFMAKSVALNKHASEETLDDLYERYKENEEVVCTISYNPVLGEKTIHKIVTAPVHSKDIDRGVGLNPNITEVDLLKIVKRNESSESFLIALLENTPKAYCDVINEYILISKRHKFTCLLLGLISSEKVDVRSKQFNI